MLKHIENLRQCSYSQPSISNDFRFSVCHLQCLHQTGRVAWPLTGTITDKLTYAHHFRSKLFLSFSDFFCHELNHQCLCIMYSSVFGMIAIFSVRFSRYFCLLIIFCVIVKYHMLLWVMCLCSVCYSTAMHFKALIWLR